MKIVRSVSVGEYSVTAGYIANIKSNKILIKEGERGGIILTDEAKMPPLKVGDLIIAVTKKVGQTMSAVAITTDKRSIPIDLGSKGIYVARVGKVGPLDEGKSGQAILSFPEMQGAATVWKKVTFWNGREGNLAAQALAELQGEKGNRPTVFIIGKQAKEIFVNGVAFFKIEKPVE